MKGVTLDRPWLEFDLGQEMRVLSWAINRPGAVQARRILWREVRNADLPLDLDVTRWFASELEARAATDAVAFLTSRDVRRYRTASATVGAARADVVATVGLSNAERVGCREDRTGTDWGTINVALRLDQGLTDAARLEAMSIAVEARTAAVMEADLPLAAGRATGTGTDCVAVAAPEGELAYAGLHTEIGEAVGRAVHEAVLGGARDWMARMRPVPRVGEAAGKQTGSGSRWT
ncbi:adenosylcobinamide amidohydrolase [Roseovarius sp. SCSIO 43702]|uniref:adenosylcobinamide amidohydrolase n=1 Tax=Roseovarius sp. SCSIO 43702 TaxID=2823043 RepID=UPI001C72E7DA|nr:adenosylcobinamide amidohydrolase [Roseovarius sp. SCSIO 43702]QYX55705.1 adenosylcobinamide amidohydrolase [Roseovarius sp. SCSIO 43702]